MASMTTTSAKKNESFLKRRHHPFHTCSINDNHSPVALPLHLLPTTTAPRKSALYSSSCDNTNTQQTQHLSTSSSATLTNTTQSNSQPEETTYDIAGLIKELSRLSLRCHKKITKAHKRHANAVTAMEELLTKQSEPTLEELEACPDVDALAQTLAELQTRLSQLQSLEATLKDMQARGELKKKGQVRLSEELNALVVDLEVNDAPPARKPQKKRVRKGDGGGKGPRLPYRRYFTKDGTEIRVGKQAQDNDRLSLSPQHRDGHDWWMHASGCPGSHVVIRGEQPPSKEVVADAAALAARQSKCQGRIIKVSMTRCRDVTKPPGAKPGLVQLRGNVRTISVNMKEAEVRLSRLDETVQIN